MGAYSPSRLDNEKLNNKIIEKIIKPTLKGLNKLNTNFVGFLYAGLMVVNEEPFLIEYNVRMGDPECQTILPKLKTDLFDIIEACVNEKLKETNIEWLKNKSLCVVLCSNGYPDNYKKNIEIKNLNNISLGKDEFLFHAGTSKQNNKIYAVGGRVLNFVSLAKDFNSAKKKYSQKFTKFKLVRWFLST
jgi:phosphoribosylamine--glycine ligase